MSYYQYRGNFLMIYLLIDLLRVIGSFSNAYEVTSMQEMVKADVRYQICENQLKVKAPLLHMCQDKVNTFAYAVAGFRKGINECQATFKKDRWNCTTHSSARVYELFGTVMARGSKEAAVMFAMVSAGMVERITAEIYEGKREKYHGKANACNQVHTPRYANGYINANDCDADVTSGEKFAKNLMNRWIQFQKANEKENIMNTHNAGVGRLAVRDHMEKICRCVGLSGACNSKCCYRTLRPLKVSAQYLRQRYIKAQKVRTGQRPKRDGTPLLITVDGITTPAKNDLIYLLDSPNYCHYDNATGSLGTKGRICNATSSDSDNCDKMCCQRGYETHQIETEPTCNCKFIWCCKVKCQKCRKKTIIHRCK